MRIADQLRALRESLPDKPGVRAVARAMGEDMPNAYGYYEGKTFNKNALPLDKAREIAAAFEKLGGDGGEVLKLAGLADQEVEREAVAVPAPRQIFIPMAVALPNEDAIVAMMRGLLLGVGLDVEADRHAETLARRLPEALAQAAGPLVAQATSIRTSRGARSQPPATPDLDQQQ